MSHDLECLRIVLDTVGLGADDFGLYGLRGDNWLPNINLTIFDLRDSLGEDGADLSGVKEVRIGAQACHLWHEEVESWVFSRARVNESLKIIRICRLLLQLLNECDLSFEVTFKIAAIVFRKQILVRIDINFDLLIFSSLVSAVRAQFKVHMLDLLQRAVEQLVIDKCEQ